MGPEGQGPPGLAASTSPPRRARLEVRSHDLGGSGKPLLLMLHANGFHGRAFLPLVSPCRGHHTCVAYVCLLRRSSYHQRPGGWCYAMRERLGSTTARLALCCMVALSKWAKNQTMYTQ